MTNNPWCVWATRPLGSNSDWAQQLHAHGFNTLELPLLDIQPLLDTASQTAIKELILNFDQFDSVIFVSQNAVRHTFDWLHDYWPQLPLGLRYFAVGERTAALASEQGVQVLAPHASMTSEALLALPELQEVWGKKILICRGLGGLPRLGEALHQRGAMVRYLELYQRLLPASAAQTLQNARSQLLPQDFLVVFSSETLQHLAQLLASLQAPPYNQPLLVPSQRVADAAAQLGFSQVLIAANASEAAMLSRLLEFTAQHSPKAP